MFDVNNFMSAVMTEVNDTKIIPCPAGEFHVLIEKVEPKSGTIGKGDRTGETWASLQLTMSVEDEAVKTFCARDKVLLSHGVMLDLTPSGGIDMGKGKNLGLGRLRDACDLNSPGQPFSPTMIVGKRVKVAVKHVPGYRDPTTLVAEVAGIIKI